MQVDPRGAAVRLGHSVSFFIGTAYGSTATAERVANTVRAMHHTVKGTRPDSLPYDADDPDWLRWNYARRWSGASPPRTSTTIRTRCGGSKIDRYYREFVKVGHALGGTDLPRPRRTPSTALRGVPAQAGTDLRRGHGHRSEPRAARRSRPAASSSTGPFVTAPSWAAAMVMHRPPNPVERAARQAAVVGDQRHPLHDGPAAGFRAARRRVAVRMRWRRPRHRRCIRAPIRRRSRATAEQMA